MMMTRRVEVATLTLEGRLMLKMWLASRSGGTSHPPVGVMDPLLF